MAIAALRAPRFPDAERSRAAAVLHWVLLTSAAVGLFGLLAAPFVYPGRMPYLLYGCVVVGCMVGQTLLRRGYVRPVALGFLALVWAVVFWAAWHFGGPRAPAMTVLPVLVLMAGFLAGTRAAIFVGVLSAGVTLALTLGGPMEPAQPLTPIRYWLAVTVSVLMAAAMVAFGLRAIEAVIAEARASERRYAEMVEASPDGMVSVNEDGVVESVNPAVTRISGAAAAAIEGHRFLDLGMIAPEYLDWVIEHAPKAFGGEFTGPAEIEALRVDGSRVPIELRVQRVQRPDGRLGVQATLRDLSPQYAVARRVEELQARLIQSQKLESVGRLVGGIAHDFNNHLTAIRINGELLNLHVEDNREARELLAGIEMAAERSAALIRQLLAFSRRQILRPRVIDLNEIVTGLEPMLRRMLPEDIDLEIRCESDLWHVRADGSQVETALMNLVVNARDAMPEGGCLTVETSNVAFDALRAEQVGVHGAGDFVHIMVRDSGVGILDEDRDRIFEPFFSTKGEFGSGLGLPAVHGIVHQSDGVLVVESEPNRGSLFGIYLPRVDEPLDVETEAGDELIPARSEGRILLVEDDEVVRSLALSVLRERGYEVWAASDGLAALDLVKRENPDPDLLVTDVVMPRLGGIGLARALRDSHPELRVLFFSGYMEDSNWSVLELGAELIRKPFSARTLATRVHAILSRA